MASRDALPTANALPTTNHDTNGAANRSITAIAGIEAGHYTDAAHGTGCTVILCRQGAVGGVDVRGGSPGTRETDLLQPTRRVERVYAVLLSGGSAFGLDAAAGVMAWLDEQGLGHRVNASVTVPIVSAAIIYDLGVITAKVRPGPAAGRAACLAASAAPLAEGSVGVGAGATAAKTGGPERAVKGGIGSASMLLGSGHTVAAAVAVNAIGGIYDYRSGRLVAGPRRPEGGFDDPVELLLRQPGGVNGLPDAPTNTTIGVIATDAALNKEEANYLARVGHNGLALTIRPCHTLRDGDTLFGMATGRQPGAYDLTALGAAAAEVTAEAVLRAIRQATGLGGFPAVSELAAGDGVE